MVNCFVWNVGDAAGWSPESQLNYTKWARPSFLVGDDSLRFVYDPNTTNVMEVTYCDFKSCNPTSPLASYNTGNDTVPITKEGHQYFISGNRVDCNNGLKLDIQATNSSVVRFWRLGGPTYDANGYGKIPEFEDAPTGGANATEDTSCDSDSSTGEAAASTPAMSPTSTEAGRRRGGQVVRALRFLY
ncbi:mavicyanin-like [Papaver somniferum]|uniref:mavicyanin-like n=1 Tax=Papaver somniferum TaxID=3469 RepID=UPI000E6F9C2A|nr:mavicyanin-like [Papaver somniferum]